MLMLMGKRRGFLRRVFLSRHPAFPWVLIAGDIILSCNEKIVTRMYDLNVHYAAESVKLVCNAGDSADDSEF